mmetsp:Transcript_91499/g.218091  ORF Transcript_91499/g.218091 Transcript_91499/m.218091 type:complete len:265 (+) Transcript_91499:249-1043(+)
MWLGGPRQLGGCVGRLPRNLQNFWHCLPRLANPMPAGIPSFFISTRDQASPGYVIFSDESSSNIGTMYFGVKLRAPVRAVLFEIIHPFENFLNATWQMRFHLCSASSCCDGTVTLSVYNEDLPVGLAFINETHCSKRPANDHIPNTGRCRADINHIQGVIIARSIVKFVVFGWITVCLWEASVVERNRSPEGSQPPRSFCVLTKNVVLEGGLELELLQGTLRHLVDVPKESCVLIQPILHKQLGFMPVRRGRVRGVPDRNILLF